MLRRACGNRRHVSACGKVLPDFFHRLLNFLNSLRSFKKSSNCTRKETLTVSFHTFFPSEAFRWRIYPRLRRACGNRRHVFPSLHIY